jgi:hypothetical protein
VTQRRHHVRILAHVDNTGIAHIRVGDGADHEMPAPSAEDWLIRRETLFLGPTLDYAQREFRTAASEMALRVAGLFGAEYPDGALDPDADVLIEVVASGSSAQLPWEVLATPTEDGPVGARICVWRSLPGRDASFPAASSLAVAPIRISVVRASPLVLQSTNSTLEVDAIRDGLASLVERGVVELIDLSHATLATLQREVDERPRVLHIAAQGDAEGISFEAGHQDVLVRYRALAAMLREARQLALVVLSVCDSAGAAPEQLTPLQLLVDEGIPSAVGMSARITPSAAWRFSEGLYRGLARGETVTHAFAEGIFALQTAPLPDRLFAGTPVLLVREDVVPIPSAPHVSGPDRSIRSREAIAALLRKLRAATPSPDWSPQIWTSRMGPVLFAATDACDSLREVGQELDAEQLVGNLAAQDLAASVRAAINSLERFDLVVERIVTDFEPPAAFAVAGRRLGDELAALARRLARSSRPSTRGQA